MADTIKEFLIGLGVSIDKPAMREASVTIANLGKEVERFVSKLIAMEALLQAAVIKTAEALENLYYVAQRASTTVGNLKALQYGMAQIGLTAGDANSALEGLAMALRINPGNESLLRYLGVATRDARGNMRDTSVVMGDFIARLSKMPFYIATQYAEMFGINSRTLLMLLQNFGDLGKAEARWRDLAKATGVDLQTSARQSRDFMNTLRETGEIIELLWIKVSTVLIAKFQPAIEKFNRFLLTHAKEIETFALDVVNAVLGFGQSIVDTLPVIDKLVRATIGWKTALELIGDIIVYRIFGPLGLALYLFTQIQQKMPDWLKERNKKLETEHPDMYGPGGTLRPGYKAPGYQMLENFFNKLGDGLRNFFSGLGSTPGVMPQSGPGFNPAFVHPAAFRIGGGSAPGAARLGSLDPQIEAEVRRQARLKGLDEEHMVNLARAEGRGFNRVSGAGAIGPMQLMPGTARGLGVNPWDWHQNIEGGMRYFAQILRQLGSYAAADAGYNAGPANRGVKWFSQTGDMTHLPWETQRYVRGINQGQRGGVTIQNHSEYHIHGSDAPGIAREVKRGQDHAEAQMVRNFRTAILA